MDANPSITVPLPATLVDQPRSRHLGIVITGVASDLRMLLLQRFPGFQWYYRVLEEATGIWELFRIRQFATTNRHDGIGHIKGSKIVRVLPIEIVAEVTVIQ